MIEIIVQPRDGIEPLIEAIKGAQQSIELTVYRADRLEIEQALVDAAERGVRVHVLTTTTNRDDARNLRRLETRLQATRVKVSQTAEDLVRYHNKMMIVDRRTLYLLTFNFTFLDIHHSRSLGLATDEEVVVEEAVRLFEADALQSRGTPEMERLIVSPHNARERLTDFILGAKKQLLIYDGRLTDAQMIRALSQRARAGLDIKVIGELNRRVREITVRPMPLVSLHAQAIIRDGESVFLGSQSLRKPELDDRREVGLIIEDREAIKHLTILFELDWGDIIKS
jgi:phosphatidylserine/phosphatidylglycerophosphate/cardiolipin synthase-like enzyme